MKFSGKILGLDGDQVLIQMLSGNPERAITGKSCDITIKERGRTLAQNNFYHLFVSEALRYYKEFDPSMGHDELHYYFRDRFLSYFRNVAGVDRRFARSTTELSIMEFCEFFENCMVQAGQDVFFPAGSFMAEYEQWKQEALK